MPGTPIRASSVALKDDDVPPIDPSKRQLKFRSGSYQGSPSGVVEPAFGSDGDPTSGGSAGGGAEIAIHGGQPGNDVLVLSLPAAGWTRSGGPSNPGYTYKDKRHTFGPISSVSIRNGRLKVRGRNLLKDGTPAQVSIGGKPVAVLRATDSELVLAPSPDQFAGQMSLAHDRRAATELWFDQSDRNGASNGNGAPHE